MCSGRTEGKAPPGEPRPRRADLRPARVTGKRTSLSSQHAAPVEVRPVPPAAHARHTWLQPLPNPAAGFSFWKHIPACRGDGWSRGENRASNTGHSSLCGAAGRVGGLTRIFTLCPTLQTKTKEFSYLRRIKNSLFCSAHLPRQLSARFSPLLCGLGAATRSVCSPFGAVLPSL